MLFYEDGTWGMTTFGVGKVEPPHDSRRCVRSPTVVLPQRPPRIRQAEPIGEVAFHKYPTSRWRRYDKLTASRPASSRSATRWSASIRRTARA